MSAKNHSEDGKYMNIIVTFSVAKALIFKKISQRLSLSTTPTWMKMYICLNFENLEIGADSNSEW